MTIDYVKNAAGYFVCQHKDCGRTFERQNTMYYHMKRHMGEFTYTCKDCKKGFIQKSAYLHHLAAVHPDEKDIINKNAPCDESEDPLTEDAQTAIDKANNIQTALIQDNMKTEEKIKTKDTAALPEKNPYAGISYKCPCCPHSTRTKANALVHYARLHAEGWIPTYEKEKGCTQCAKTFGSIAAYLYHCTGCIPANKNHRTMIAKITETV
jgi:hypothetical protein